MKLIYELIEEEELLKEYSSLGQKTLSMNYLTMGRRYLTLVFEKNIDLRNCTSKILNDLEEIFEMSKLFEKDRSIICLVTLD